MYTHLIEALIEALYALNSPPVVAFKLGLQHGQQFLRASVGWVSNLSPRVFQGSPTRDVPCILKVSLVFLGFLGLLWSF